MKRILCVRLPNWPLQQLVVASRCRVGQAGSRQRDSADPPECGVHFGGSALAEASLTHPTILLYARDARRGECIVTCSQAAHACGVRPGMPLAEAQALVIRISSRHTSQKVGRPFQAYQDGPEGPSYLHDPAADLAALAKLAEQCERFSPLVGWETVEGAVDNHLSRSRTRQNSASPNSYEFGYRGWGASALFLDVTGSGVLFGGEEQLLLAAQEEFVCRGYRVKLAIAETIGAAWALTFADCRVGQAGSRQRDSADPPECGVHPGGSALVEASRPGTRQYCDVRVPCARHPTLFPLPISTLRVPHETVDLLAQLGVTTIDQLLELPRDALASRFGERLPLRLAQALGEAGEVIAPHHPPPLFAADWILEVPRGDWESLELIFQQLLARITAAMRQRQEGAVRLVCRLDCADAAPLRLEVGLFRPSAVPRHLWDLVRMQLEQRSLPGLVGRITVQVVQSAPLESRQSELFDGSVLEGTRELSLLIDRLSGRLGMDAVVRPQPKHDPLPEKAFCEMPLAGQIPRRVGPARSRQRSSAGPPAKNGVTPVGRRPPAADLSHPTSVLCRPLELFDPPVILEVLSVVPDGPPIRFSFRGKSHRIARHWGPERIETGWWRGPSVRRDYYRVETEEGQRFWLFRRLEDGAWGMHGVFA